MCYLSQKILSDLRENCRAYYDPAFSRHDLSKKAWYESGDSVISSIAIVVIAMEIESIRNTIAEHHFNGKYIKREVYADLAKILAKRIPKFPAPDFKQRLAEIFVVRDVIIHSHVYEISTELGEWERVLKQNHLRQKDEYKDRKFTDFVKKMRKRTKLMDLNVIPTNVSYEDVFKCILFLDLLIVLLNQNGYSIMDGPPAIKTYHHPYRDDGLEIEEVVFTSWSRLLGYYFKGIQNKPFIKRVEFQARQLKEKYSPYIKRNRFENPGILNFCPKCKKFGFESESFHHEPGSGIRNTFWRQTENFCERCKIYKVIKRDQLG